MPVEKVAIELEFSGTTEPDTAECDRPMEFITRIAVVPLQPRHSILRLVLTYLGRLFAVTREVPRKRGAGIARAPQNDVQYQFSHFAIWMLKPVLACRLQGKSSRAPFATGYSTGTVVKSWCISQVRILKPFTNLSPRIIGRTWSNN